MPVILHCEQCQSPFSVDPRLTNKARFCSRACKHLSQRLPDETRICGECGKKFPLPRTNQARAMARYCSRKCGHAASAITRTGLGIRRFWTNVEQCRHEWLCPYCCWPWKGTLTSNGYGIVTVKGKVIMANRKAWELSNGRLMPDDLLAAHYCHNRPCCNPMHIHAATQKENMADSVRDRRHYHGERHHNAKLTRGTIKEAFDLRRNGVSIDGIARHLSVSFITIQKLLARETWKYLDIDNL